MNSFDDAVAAILETLGDEPAGPSHCGRLILVLMVARDDESD